uniref:Nitrogen regulatory protein P-II n=1 Tax=Dechloromonas aromatica (strain RCB) TaxID=159087 RepID=Q47DU3_DECAR
MKEIKAFIHPHRTAAVIQALRESGACDTNAGASCFHIAISQVQCVHATSDGSQHYSVELAEPVVLQTKLELVCEDDTADLLVDLIVRHGHAGQVCSGWVHVHVLERRIPIG